MRVPWPVLLLTGALLAACGPAATRIPPASAARVTGPLFVALAPLAADGSGLQAELGALGAVAAGGAEVVLPEAGGPWPLSGSGRLVVTRVPAGSYRGFVARFASAALQGEEGPASLRLADEALEIPFPFTVGPDRAAVVQLSLEERGSVEQGFRFIPRLTALAPPRTPTEVLGLVSGCGSDSIVLLDLGTGRLAGALATPGTPGGLALDTLRRRAYVALPEEDAVAVIDLLESRQIARIALTGGDRPVELALSPDGRRLLSVNPGTDTVSFLDPEGLFEQGRVRVGEAPRSVTLDPSGRTAYVFSPRSNTVSVLSMESGTAAGRLVLDGGPFRGAFDGQGRRLYVIHQTLPRLTVLDVRTLTVERQAMVGPGARAVAVDPRSGRIYLARDEIDGVEVLDPLSHFLIARLPATEAPSHLLVDARRDRVGMVLPRSGRIHLAGLTRGEDVLDAPVGPEPCWLELSGER